MKIKFGYLTGADGGTTEDIIVKSALPNKAKDVLIGGGMILFGVAYLCYTAFKNGVNEAAIAEQRVYKNAGYLNELTAKYTGRKVSAGPSEATAIGNIIVQMLYDGTFKSLPEARTCIGESFDVKIYEN